MSFQLMAWAMEQEVGTSSEKFVLLALADRANGDTGRCDPSVERIARDTELSDATVRRCLKALADKGFVKRKRRRRSDGSLGVYEFEFPLAQDLRTPAVRTSGRASAHDERAEPREDLEPGGVALHPSASPSDSEPPPPPRLTKIDGQDLAFNEIAKVCNAKGANRSREVAVALNGDTRRGTVGIREQFWRETLADGRMGPLTGDTSPIFESALATAIRERAQMYHVAMSGATLTPTALAKWWGDLPAMVAESSIEGFYDNARDAVARARGGTNAG